MLLTVQEAGIGVFEPNTLLIGFKEGWRASSSENTTEYIAYVDTLKIALKSGKSIIVLKVPI